MVYKGYYYYEIIYIKLSIIIINLYLKYLTFYERKVNLTFIPPFIIQEECHYS